jgi:serine/threonine-protein kinase
MRTRRPLADLGPGDTIGGYELLHPAARGGFATVWAARRRGPRGFEPIVALKLLHDDVHGDADAEAMFFDEAQTAASIIHPNVGQVLDFGEDAGRPYLVMEWIDGESLSAIFSARRASGLNLPLPWILHVAAAACAGLHAAHELRDEDGRLVDLVHRDVSPQNVMVTWDGVVKVVDFGVAKSRRRVHVTRVLGTLKGKVGYFSPEQIEGRAVDRRSDVFSFGTMLYLLTTGVHPFRKAEEGGTIASIARGEARPARSVVPDLCPAFEAVLAKALAKDVTARYQSAAELELGLESVIVELRCRLAEEQVGEFVRALFPDKPAEREEKLAHAIEEADRVRAERAARASERPSARSSAPGPRPADRIGPTVRPGARGRTVSERAREETLAAPDLTPRVPVQPASRYAVPVLAASLVVVVGLAVRALARGADSSPSARAAVTAPAAPPAPPKAPYALPSANETAAIVEPPSIPTPPPSPPSPRATASARATAPTPHTPPRPTRPAATPTPVAPPKPTAKPSVAGDRYRPTTL